MTVPDEEERDDEEEQDDLVKDILSRFFQPVEKSEPPPERPEAEAD